MRLRTCRPPRVSIHITHGPTGTPLASTGMVLAHWPVTLTAATRDASTAPLLTPSRTASRITSHHTPASCSAPPWGRNSVFTSRCVDHTIPPARVTNPTLGPPVPRSMARQYRSRSTVIGLPRTPRFRAETRSCAEFLPESEEGRDPLGDDGLVGGGGERRQGGGGAVAADA